MSEQQQPPNSNTELATQVRATEMSPAQPALSKAAHDALTEAQERKKASALSKELNGPKGPEPTRYGDWELKGRCYDF